MVESTKSIEVKSTFDLLSYVGVNDVSYNRTVVGVYEMSIISMSLYYLVLTPSLL